jgi:hypothetical protein
VQAKLILDMAPAVGLEDLSLEFIHQQFTAKLQEVCCHMLILPVYRMVFLY